MTIYKLTPKLKHTFTRTILVAAICTTFSGAALADSYDDQIAALKVQAAAQQATASQFAAQASDYQTRVNQLRAQMNAMQAQINLSQAQYAQVSASITANEAKLAVQKESLAANLKSMYLDSSVTPIEMIASSNNFSDYFNQQQYQDSIKNKIQAAMADILATQKQLEAQKIQVTALLAQQNAQQQQLVAAKNEADQLLATASQSAAAANAQVAQSNAQITSLKQQQAAVLAARYGSASGGASCGGGYPGKWCNAPQDSVVDSWGMYNRECVSYTAFRVAASGRNMPYWGGRGNANQWPGDARAAGIPVDGNPRVGDVAISMLGPYGHAMYVEAVSDGRITVSQYNYGAVPGMYSTMTISAAGLYFIHF